MHRTTPAMAAVLALAALALPPTPAPAAACTSRLYERSIACHVNAVRARHGRVPLRRNARLSHAAGLHAADMVRRRYFSHRSPDGSGPAARTSRTGYARGAGSWMVGEALAWASPGRWSAASVVRAWLRSPAHPRVLLLRRARELGVGAVLGLPFAGRRGVTVALLVGRRS